MISKVTSITPKQIYAEFNKLPKEVKIAIAALTAFAIGYTAVRLIQRLWTTGPVEKPKATIDDLVEIARLLEGREVVEIPDDVVAKESINPTEKDQIVSDILKRHQAFSKFIPICKGNDSLARPFYYFAFNKENDKKVLGIIISTVHVNGISELLIEKLGEFEVGNDPTAFLQGLINGTNTQYKLIEAEASSPSKEEKGPTVHKDMFDSLLILKLFPAWQKKPNLPVIHVPKEKREDTVDSSAKLNSIKSQCLICETTSTPINVGLDSWGNPFLEIRYFDSNTHQQGFQYIYKANDDWYIDDQKLTDGASDLLLQLIKGEHSTFKLAESNP